MKQKEKKEKILNFLGILIILIGIYRIFQIIYFAGDFPRLFWFCNISPIIIGLAILYRNSFVLIGTFSVLFFGQIFWTADLVIYAFSGSFLLKTAEYILYENVLSQIGTISVHILILPLAFLAIIILGKANKNAWKFSFLFFAALLPFVIYFGREYNLNLFYYHNISFLPEIPFHPLVFPLAYIFLVVFPISALINKVILRIRK